MVPWHGNAAARYNWLNPVRTLESSKKARPEYTTVDAHEYRDHETVLNEKIVLLASFIRQAKHCVAYTGAGLSRSSGLDDYASDRTSTQQRGYGAAAQPNDSHKALTKLHQAGYLKAVVNQNHDGLLQKAGFPQQCVNEIHGSWFDPSNPGGNILRDDLFDNLLQHEANTDLCLALGTSLSGLNADRVATTATLRSPGLVICNLQCTQLDHMSSLRLFAPLDDVLARLLKQLKLDSLKVVSPSVTSVPKGALSKDIFTLPYDAASGERSATKTCLLDLTAGSRFKIVRGSFANCVGEVMVRQPDGHWRLKIHQQIDEETTIVDEHLLGAWWMTAALQGLVPFLPIVPHQEGSLDGSNDVIDRIIE